MSIRSRVVGGLLTQTLVFTVASALAIQPLTLSDTEFEASIAASGERTFGVLVGWWISDLGPEATAVEALVSGFAAGSFVFLAAHELQPAEGHRPAASLSRGTRAGLAFGGLGCMALLVFMGA